MLRPLQEAIGSGQIELSAPVESWREFCVELRKLKGFGEFMAKEVMLDLTLTHFWIEQHVDCSYPVDWWKWTPVGPGALRGMSRVKDEAVGYMLPEEARGLILRLVDDCPEINGHRLNPTDIQFGLCEYDKYCRGRKGFRLKNRYVTEGLPLL